MNPILQRLYQNKNPPTNSAIDNLLSDIQSGRIDPKQEVLSRIQKMNPLQRMTLKAALSMLERVGKQYGITDNDIQSVKQVLQL